MTPVESAPLGGAEHFGEAWPKLLQFADMIVREGEKRGLVGPRELERLWSRHILNSTAVLEFIPQGSRVGDVGSGAGFPGLVIAVCRPDCQVTLIDSMERRCEWLLDAIAELELTNVSVKLGRAEEFVGNYSADVVTSRAVAALKKLLDAGANTRLTDRAGNTPLALARDRGFTAMVKMLEAAGAR